MEQLKQTFQQCLSQVELIARRLALDQLSGLEGGYLEIEEPDGNVVKLGKRPAEERNGADPPNGKSRAGATATTTTTTTTTTTVAGPIRREGKLKVHSPYFWIRVVLAGDNGFAESYMLGEISSPDITAFFEVIMMHYTAVLRRTSGRSTSSSLNPASYLDTLSAPYRLVRTYVLRKVNDIGTARLNAQAHYSLSNAIFAAFLSPDMTYSAPLWLPPTDPGASEETLEHAQRRKLRATIAAARIGPEDHVLEIGAGWGSFAIEAVSETGCRVTTVTPSAEQKALVEARARDAGVGDRVTVLCCDYREVRTHVAEARGGRRFDKIISIEMIEHVGHRYLETYFACVDEYLTTDSTGIAVFQCITMPESRYANYLATEDFLQKYIFPGGELPTPSGLVDAIVKGSQGRLMVEEMKSIAAHYPRALRLWREKFEENFEAVIAPDLKRKNTSMTEADIQVFRRKWEVSNPRHSPPLLLRATLRSYAEFTGAFY